MRLKAHSALLSTCFKWSSIIKTRNKLLGKGLNSLHVYLTAISVALCLMPLCSTATLPQTTIEPDSAVESTSTITHSSLSTAQCFTTNKRWPNPCHVRMTKRSIPHDESLRDNFEVIRCFINGTVKENIFKNYITNPSVRRMVQELNLDIFPKDFNSDILNLGNKEKLARHLYVYAAAVDYLNLCGTARIVESKAVDQLRNVSRLIYNAVCTCTTDLYKAGLDTTVPSPQAMLSKELTELVTAGDDEMWQYMVIYSVVQEIELNIGDLEMLLAYA